MRQDDLDLLEEREVSFPPAHTAEHLLNQTMIRLFGCERSYNAHIERKKSKMSFYLDRKPSRQDEKFIEQEMNRLINEDLPVTFEFASRDELPEGISLERLPDDASDTIRLVRIGDYDVCPCIGWPSWLWVPFVRRCSTATFPSLCRASASCLLQSASWLWR